jgi:fructose-1,6-bisphosphatase/inositol monophosphatase family enzyme
MPALGELLVAARGEGCSWNGRRARVSSVASLSESLLLCTDVEGMARYGRAGAYRRLAAATKMQRSWGDAYGYALVATGRAEVMLDPVVSIWDCAAILPVLEEAGGSATNWSGRTMLDGGELIGTNGLVLKEVLAMISVAEDDPYVG